MVSYAIFKSLVHFILCMAWGSSLLVFLLLYNLFIFVFYHFMLVVFYVFLSFLFFCVCAIDVLWLPWGIFKMSRRQNSPFLLIASYLCLIFILFLFSLLCSYLTLCIPFWFYQIAVGVIIFYYLFCLTFML